ncbi:MAG: branched-chain amino acid ABC transporter permease [Methanotrichaceae archaeon]|nr:branched-chain amino acid ABC transporter permease [Methanotrichaceae archaeon]
MSAEVFWQSLVNGLMMGMIYVLIALGLTLLYSIMHIVNFAHGEIYMLGGFVSYYLVTQLEFNYFVSLPVTMGVLFVAGIILEKLFFSRVRGNFMHCLLLTLGISLIFQSLGWTFFGTEDVSIPSPISGVFKFGGIFIPKQRILSALIGFLLVGLLYLLIAKTKIGRHMRSIEQDSEASELFGVNINLVNMVALGIGFALAAIGGALIGSIFVLNPSIGLVPMLKAFVIIIMGGLGSIGGCILAGLLLGIIDSVVATLLGANLAYVVAFAILILIIIIRPRGFLGHA